jgi:hypothetical protein
MSSSRTLKKWNTSTIEFLVEECGGGGDCMFHAVAAAFNRLFTQTVTMQTIRDALATSINSENIHMFAELMDIPMNLSLTQVRDLVRRPGASFQGTDVVLQWLCMYSILFTEHRVGVVCFTGYGPGYEMRIGDDEATQLYILLYNHFGTHWQLANIHNPQTGTHHCAINTAACARLFDALLEQNILF